VRPVTVLVVEDNDVALRVVKRTLELEGRCVECCRDGDDAMRELGGGGQYDLIITENGLPGASGLELIRRARALPHGRHTPIIMFSSGPHREEALGAGANEFLKKPEGIYAMLETVTLLLGAPAASRVVKDFAR
jgi:CheY-like chemotaxis protein